MKYNLPRKYLSYSAFNLWLKNKDQFRRRYYENEKPFETVETIFGKTVHEKLDKGADNREKRLEAYLIPGLKLLGYIDEFNEKTLAIVDDKTGHLNIQGKPPWNQVKVQKHKQLDFYCLLTLLKYGKYNRDVKLRWLETRFKEETKEFNGHVLKTKSRNLELTGYEKTFTRKIYKWEIENLKKEIIKVAEDISKDYTLWQKTNQK